ncbi:MAG: 50S ribosomal protein L13 [Candidatus Latescibacteria bacterium]|nr:50S ribosomal protein L13 [Candidatus Latescibacterota bacterium]
MKSYVGKISDVKREWYLFDANGKTLGRFATKIARVLTGKDKPTFTPHIDSGDFVIVVNAASFRVTGKKMTDKFYYRHSGYPSGLKQTSLRDMLAKHPTRVLELAVKRMLPKNRMQARRMKRLMIYADANHPHQAQKPIVIEDSKTKG